MEEVPDAAAEDDDYTGGTRATGVGKLARTGRAVDDAVHIGGIGGYGETWT